MKNLRYDNEQCQSVAYEKALPALLRQLRRVAVERRPECCLRKRYGARLKMKEVRHETET